MQMQHEQGRKVDRARSRRARNLAAVFAGAVVVSSTPAAWAAPTTLIDRSALGATVDGSVGAGEYTASSTGINAGFGGFIGAGTSYGVESSVSGVLTLGLSGSVATTCPTANVIVVYIDSIAGGFASTTGFTDNADQHRAAISAMGTSTGRADLTFAPGFQADFAIAITPALAGLWQLQDGTSHVFVKTLTATPETDFGDSCDHELSGLTLADLGLAPGGQFRYIVTLLDSVAAPGAYRSSEFHGVAATTVSGNPGNGPLTLASGDFNTFESVLVLLSEIDADTASTDMLEFIELYDRGAGNVDLGGLVVVLFNGVNEQAYRSVDLDGRVTDAQGRFVLGSATVTGADLVLGTTDLVQNGADAAALYLANDTDFPLGSIVTGVNLVDAVVYDTSDPDDPELLAALTPGQPQVNEDANVLGASQSIQRCGGGALVTTGYSAAAPTPDAANACCGNGVVDGAEVCDDADGQDLVGCNNACSGCAADYYGASCGTFCSGATTCGGHGSCNGSGACVCDSDYYGASCGAFCSASTTCGGHGSCNGSGACVCAAGYYTLSCSTTQCGDGTTAGSEQCDDGNTTAGDGCDDQCRTEAASACGTGTAEDCDAGEPVPGDAGGSGDAGSGDAGSSSDSGASGGPDAAAGGDGGGGPIGPPGPGGGSSEADAGESSDDEGSESSGCGCRIERSSGTPISVSGLALFVAVLLLRRSRRLRGAKLRVS